MTTPGTVAWLTGLPAAGKTTIADLVAAGLHDGGQSAEVIDGDRFRASAARQLGFTEAARAANVAAIITAAAQLRESVNFVLVAAVSPYRRLRAQARARFQPRFIEVHVTAPLEECIRRDPKGLYAQAMAGEIDHFTGISDPYEPPQAPELVLNTLRATPEESAGALLALLT